MSRPIRLLIVEDSNFDAIVLLREFEHSGYKPEYEIVETPQAMNAALAARQWDIVIPDYVMPDFSGTEFKIKFKGEK